MRYPFGLVFAATRHVLGQKLRGRRKFAVVLSLDPLGAGDRTANGGKRSGRARPLTVGECLRALEECNTPVVVISGGEPLEYEEMPVLARAILDRGKHLFLSTDGTLIRRHLHMIPPYTEFFWNVRLSGTEAVHDQRVRRPGVFREALDGIKAAKNAGFFVLVTTTVYPDTNLSDVEALYERLHTMHVDGYLLSPYYPEERLCRDSSRRFHEQMRARFREASEQLASYNLLVLPFYMEYLRGERELGCCAWGGPVFGPQGWTGPCRVLGAAYATSYQELLQETVWENYGRGLNPRCENCECSEGFETAAIMGMNRKAGDIWKLLAWQWAGRMGEKREGRRPR